LDGEGKRTKKAKNLGVFHCNHSEKVRGAGIYKKGTREEKTRERSDLDDRQVGGGTQKGENV